MKQNLRLVLILTGLLLPFMSSVWAAVYKCESDFGQVKFSDEPCSRGESSTRVKWLKPSYSTPAKKSNKKTQAKDNSILIKTKQPVTLVTLLTTTRLQIKTESLTSSRGDEMSNAMELLLSDGIILDLRKVKSIDIAKSGRKDEILAQIVMQDGFKSLQSISRPFPIIAGDINIGRFSKSLEDIKTLEFYNSDKLPQAPKMSKPVPLKQEQTLKQAQKMAEQETPVIELDLSENRPAVGAEASAAKTSTIQSTAEPRVKVSAVPYLQKQSSAVDDSPAGSKAQRTKPARASQRANVTLANDTRLKLDKNSMGSQRGSVSVKQQLLLSNNVKVPFSQIKQIKIRPTSDRSALVVAVHLLSGEIKMENMSSPFTAVSGQNNGTAFTRSLLDIKSITLK